MAYSKNNERNAEQTDNPEQIKIEVENVGENLDLKGGRVIHVPDFVELATQGFSEGELKDMLRLRRRYNEGEDYEITPEHKRLSFARWMYQQGKLES
jgi:hypothetical protein